MSLPLNWPAALDALANPSPTQQTDDPGFELDLVVTRIHDLLEAMERRFGTGTTGPTPVADRVYGGTGTGTAGWRQVATGDLTDQAVSSAKIQDLTIVNGDISNAAAIAYGKLALAGSVAATDLVPGATYRKLAEITATGGSTGLAYLNIPPGYRSLRVLYNVRRAGGTAPAADTVLMRVGYSGAMVTSTTYDTLTIQGFGTTVNASEALGAGGWSVGYAPQAGAVGSVTGMGEILLPFSSDATFEELFIARAVVYVQTAYGTSGGLLTAQRAGLLRTAKGVVDRLELFLASFGALADGSVMVVYGEPI